MICRYCGGIGFNIHKHLKCTKCNGKGWLEESKLWEE